MAQGRFRAEFDDDGQRTTSSRSLQDDVRLDWSWDAPCRILAGIFMGLGDVVSPSVRTRRAEEEDIRSTDTERTRSELDYELSCRNFSCGGRPARRRVSVEAESRTRDDDYSRS
jgi:hypothetical protein